MTSHTSFYLPDLPCLRLRLSMRLLEDASLPAYKGGIFRGGFGYAFQRATCPEHCWGAADDCRVEPICPYRWVFETPRPAGIEQLHDLRDIPRPFVLRLSPDERREYRAGDVLEFELTIIGRGVDYLPFFLFSFEALARMGLGAGRARARLERAEALEPWQPTGVLVYHNGQVLSTPAGLPQVDSAAILAQAAALGTDLRIELEAPLRVKANKQFINKLHLPAMVRALSWRLNALAVFHGDGPWQLDYRPWVARAADVTVAEPRLRWKTWERRTDHRGQAQNIPLSGLVGTALLREVPLELRALLLSGSVVHIGNATVFGYGAFRLLPA